MTRVMCALVAALIVSGVVANPPEGGLHVVSGFSRMTQTHPRDSRTAIRFTDVTREAGIEFRHINGASPDKYLVETIGSGGLFFDYDSDGWIDIFLVDGGSIADAAAARQARHRLFRNRGNGTFQDVTAQSGIHHREYGMG
ncbi:MAG: FG-GAP repeat domain-containing protein, partial [Vicinamibacterales bacterium]